MAGKYQKNTAKRGPMPIVSLLGTVVTWVLVIVAVGMMIFTVISVNTFDRNDRDLFGYKAYIVRSDSMSATDFDAGDLVLIQEVDPSTLQVGDIISYQSTNSENFGATVTHKIRRLTTDAQGNPGFITYGTTTDTDDETVVTYPYVLGKYKGKLPGVGTFFFFLKTTPGYICCILLPFLLLIGMQGAQSVRLFKQYKAEQLAEIEEKRAREMAELEEQRKVLEAERAETKKMMEQLMQMQAKLQSQREE